jgi:hypothetical protein
LTAIDISGSPTHNRRNDCADEFGAEGTNKASAAFRSPYTCRRQLLMLLKTFQSSKTFLTGPEPIGSALRFCAIFALYSALTVIFFWRLVPFLDNSLIGPPEDNMIDFWNIWYTAVSDRGDNFFYTNLIKFPEGTPLYYHAFPYPKIFAIWLITRIVAANTSTLILLQNLSILLSFPLAGVGAFYLVRHFVSDYRAAAVLGGIIYAFNPSHIAHALHQVHVSSIEFIPFFVLSYLLALGKRNVFWLALAVCFYCLSALSCWYYLFYIGYFIVFQTSYTLYSTPQVPRAWSLCLPALTVTATMVCLSPLLLPMIGEALAGANVYVVEEIPSNTMYVADAVAYFTFPPTHFFSALTDRLNLRFRSTVYLGLVNLALVAWALFSKSKKNRRLLTNQRRLLVYVFSGMAVFSVLASGASLHVLGHSTIPMPDRWLDQIPFFRNVRTSSRAIVFVYLFLAIGVGQAYVLLLRQGSMTLGRSLLAMGVAVLIALDFYPARLFSVTPISCSPGFSIIANDAAQDFGILTLPRGYLSGAASMMQQICHGRPIVGGTISREVTQSLVNRLETADLRSQRQQLVANRVKYIVINLPNYDWLLWNGDDGLLQNYLRFYPILYEGGDIVILQVY